MSYSTFSVVVVIVVAILVNCSLISCTSETLEPDQLVIVLLSQANSYHKRIAIELREDVYQQCNGMKSKPSVLLLHEEWRDAGTWTILPTFERLATKHESKAKWVLYMDEFARVNLKKLLEALSQFDATQALFVGHALRDEQASIMHHFDGLDGRFMEYPYFISGFAMTMTLITSSSARYRAETPRVGFHIDVYYELAKWLRDGDLKVTLTPGDKFCATEDERNCAIWPAWSKRYKCEKQLSDDRVLFAVRTTKKYHEERIPVVRQTWAKDANHIIYFSETADARVPTRVLNVTNVEIGFCVKTFALLKEVAGDPALMAYDWIVMTDDDTLVSVPRMMKMLSCYNPRELVAIGERYGYALLHHYGYNYLTGGAGVGMSTTLVKHIIDNGCSCGSDDAPEDMLLGMCYSRLAIPVVNSFLFHQGRPIDYSKGYLAHQRSISFHKFNQIEPVEVYNQWLRVDPARREDDGTETKPHTEL